MPVTEPQAVRYSNEKVRVTADFFLTLYHTCKRLKLDWDNQNLAALIPNDDTVIEDGSTVDGRSPITGAMVHNIMNRAFEFTSSMEEGGNGRLNTVDQVAVNGQSAF